MMMMNVNGFQKGVLKYLKEFHEIFKYFKVKYFIVHLYVGCWKKEHGKKEAE